MAVLDHSLQSPEQIKQFILSPCPKAHLEVNMCPVLCPQVHLHIMMS